ncbi:hypothetical protein ACHQM5_021691 [Ranunculus cassubicifolius]
MVKQKIVIRVSMNDAKSRTKAMKIVVSASGVVSAAIEGDSKNQIALTGEGIDSTTLTLELRKKVGFTEIVSIGKVKDKKEEEKKKDCDKVCNPYCYGTPQIYFAEAHGQSQDCTIM